MAKLKSKAYKTLKFIHLLSVSVWIGAGFTAFFLLTVVLDGSNITGVLQSIHYIDLLIIIPANLLTLITGILFSTKTDWGFFKHKWITLKYIINFIPILSGGLLMAPAILNMMSIAETLGEKALLDSEFIFYKMMLTIPFVVIVVLLAAAVYLSVFKPELNIHKKLNNE